jgi:hypothetical protein
MFSSLLLDLAFISFSFTLQFFSFPLLSLHYCKILENRKEAVASLAWSCLCFLTKQAQTKPSGHLAQHLWQPTLANL